MSDVKAESTGRKDVKAIVFGVVFFIILIAMFSPSEPKPKSANFLENITVSMVPASYEDPNDAYQVDVDVKIHNQNDFAVIDITISCTDGEKVMSRNYFKARALSYEEYPNVVSDFSGRSRWDIECKIISATPQNI